MPRVVIAPDKFKGSLDAAGVARAIAAGLSATAPDVHVVVVPVADGGDGTVDAAVAAGFDRIELDASGPTGRSVRTSWARSGHEAVVELADVSGLARLPDGRLRPLTASSRGTGEVIAAALDAGCTRIVVGIGGSACTDGGAGLAAALGVRILDAEQAQTPDGGAALTAARSLDLDTVHPGLATAEIVVACDVDNPLTGPDGAAAVYGPQKGASPSEVAQLDGALRHWADLVATATGSDHRDVPGAGAAGGVGFGLMALAGAEARPGAELVFQLTGLREAVVGADLVITGEGSLDEQSLRGKAPAAVAAVARAAGVDVVAVAGRCTLTEDVWRAAGFAAVHTTTDAASTPAESMTAPVPLLEAIGRRLGTALQPVTARSRPRRPAAGTSAPERTHMTTPHYYVPTGGHPAQTELTTDRAMFTEAYAVLPRGTMRDIVTSLLPFWENTRLWVLARPLSGFSETFSQYIVEVSPGGGSDRPELDAGAEGVLFVVAGTMTLTLDGQAHVMTPGGYAFVPPGTTWTLHVDAAADGPARFHWIRKAYQVVDGLETPESFVTNETDVEGGAMPGTQGRWITQRFTDPADVRHDMHVNIVSFEPGGVIPFPETHVMEHGLYVLEGKAVYLLNKDWIEVQEGDFMWLRAFCPQACYAGGPGRFRYLLYKDVNRHASLSRQFV